MLGWRIRDLDLGYLPFLRGKGIAQYTSDPVFLNALQETLGQASPPGGRISLAAIGTLLELASAYPGSRLTNLRSGLARAAVRRFVETYSRPSLSWDDLAFLRERTRLPILLKGILHPADAHAALAHGMDGIVVSNHGGRQVDGAIASMDALRGSSRPSQDAWQSCSTAACVPGPTSFELWPSVHPRSGWVVRMSGVSQPAAKTGCERSFETSARTSTSRWA